MDAKESWGPPIKLGRSGSLHQSDVPLVDKIHSQDPHWQQEDKVDKLSTTKATFYGIMSEGDEPKIKKHTGGEKSGDETNQRRQGTYRREGKLYTNCRANSLLEWKIEADREANNYLLQSFLRKEKWKESESNEHESSNDQNGRTETSHTTKFTIYRQREETVSQKGETH